MNIRKQCDKLWADAVRKKAGGCCEKCGTRKYIQAHHIFPRTCFSLRYDIENGVALCRKHHLYWAHKDAIDFYNWIKTKRNIDYLESCKMRQSKNDYQAIKLYLESKFREDL